MTQDLRASAKQHVGVLDQPVRPECDSSLADYGVRAGSHYEITMNPNSNE